MSLIHTLFYSDVVMFYTEFGHFLIRCIKRKQSYYLLKTVKSSCFFGGGITLLYLQSGRSSSALALSGHCLDDQPLPILVLYSLQTWNWAFTKKYMSILHPYTPCVIGNTGYIWV